MKIGDTYTVEKLDEKTGNVTQITMQVTDIKNGVIVSEQV